MKLNERTVITGNSVVLVPYEECHVPKYHEWMKSEELQLLTASEPLSIEEEYNMQKSWREDSDSLYRRQYVWHSHTQRSKDEVEAMVGDTNIFLKSENDFIVGEVEIMVAEKSARGKGLGKEAVLLMLRYGVENLHIDVFEAKIGINNMKSISLFNKIGFEEVCENNVFQEITLEKRVTENWIQWLLSNTSNYLKTER